jgi:hypothetical protein
MAREREVRISTSALLWGILWRSAVWYTAAGAALGGLYGCAVVVAAFFTPGLDEDGSLWALRTLVMFCAAAGFVVGWVMARAVGQEMRPLLGAVIGALAGITLGGSYLMFAYFIAFPVGAVLGGMYGLAVGLIDALLVAAVTRLLFFPLSEPVKHRRVVVVASVLGVLVVPGYWFISSLRSSGYEGFGGITGSFWGDVFIYTGFPPLLLALVAQWLGGRLAGWYKRNAPGASAGGSAEPRLARVLRNSRTARRTLVGALAGVVLLALIVGAGAYQNRTILTYIPSHEAVLSQDGEKAAALSHGEFAVYSVPEGRRLHTLPLSRAEVSDLDAAVWASNGRFLATSDGERVHVYDAAEKAEIASLPVEAASQIAWSPDGSLLAVSTLEGTDDPFAAESKVRLWSRHRGRWMHTLPIGEVSSVMAFDRDGHIFAATTMDDGVQLWDVLSGRHLRTLDGNFESGISFSPDGRLFRRGRNPGEAEKHDRW